MPGFNRKGPAGQGPMTGRRMGQCTQYGTNEKAMNASFNERANESTDDGSKLFGRGGRGLGAGRGFRFRRGHSD